MVPCSKMNRYHLFAIIITLSIYISSITYSSIAIPLISADIPTKTTVKLELDTPAWSKIYSSHSWDVVILESEYNVTVKQMLQICKTTLWNALESTIYFSYSDNTTFVITGDIYDMWIRDSTEQIWPYFILIHQYKYIQLLIRGLVLKQAQLINADIYSNSYNAESYCIDSDLKLLIKQPIGATHDLEIDSGAYFIKLLYEYYNNTEDTTIFTLMDGIVKIAIYRLVEMWEIEQYHDTKSEYPSYLPKVDYTGMIWTSHRPSDDIVRFRIILLTIFLFMKLYILSNILLI